MEMPVRIEAVRVIGRHRTDLGDLTELADSIDQQGLINAITLTPDMRLVAGERRLEACRRLGWEWIDARMVDNLGDAVKLLRAERDENRHRKPMTTSEQVALAQALEDLERPRVEALRHDQRVRAGKARHGIAPAHGSHEPRAGRVRDVAAAAVGMSPVTYQRAKRVVRAAADDSLPAEQRAVAREALADMDATGNVFANYDKVRVACSPREIERAAARKADEITRPVGQRRALDAAVQTLAGIAMGLEKLGEIHPAVTAQEAAHWVDGLAHGRRVLESTIKKLRGHTSTQGEG